MIEEPLQQEAPKPDRGLLGKGYNVLPSANKVVGSVRAVRTPKEVMQLMRSPQQLQDTIVLTRGGAVTFAGPLLMKKPAGVITIEGSAESHLGILAREFTVPAVMSIELTDSRIPRMTPDGIVRDEYVEHVIGTLNGRRVQLDCSNPSEGRVLDGGNNAEPEGASPV